MSQTIREVMSPNPVTIASDATTLEAARLMKDEDIGPVIVLDQNSVCGILTDRDIVVRAVAEGKDPSTTPVRDVCSRGLVSLDPEASVDEAVQLMRDRAIRRIPVVENGQPIGIVSIGDLAIETDPHSALADISAAPAND